MAGCSLAEENINLSNPGIQIIDLENWILAL